MQWVKTNPLETLSEYPFTGKVGNCNYDKSKGVGQVSNVVQVKPNDLTAFKIALGNGPVAIGIEASNNAIKYYTKGIINKGCGANV